MKNWITGKVKDFASGITSSIKGVLGIHSPSRVFRDEIGKNMALGIGVGFENNIKSVYDKMKTSVDFETQKLSSTVSANASISKLFKINMQLNGDVFLDNEKVGRAVTPEVSRNLAVMGV